MFFIEGIRNFVQTVDHGFSIHHLLYSETLLINPLARKMVRRCRRLGVPTEKVSPEAFRKLSRTKRASGVAAIVRQKWQSLQSTHADLGMCWIVLERVNSPGNLGTLIRTSKAVGGAGVIFVGNSVEPFSPDVIRASMGAIFQQTFVRTNWTALTQWAQSQNCTMIGATPDGPCDLYAFNAPSGTPLLMLGEERKGLTQAQTQHCDALVRIPMCGDTDSLNLGVAGSLMLYEVHRRQT